MKQKPLSIGLLLCETDLIEEGSRNASLVNCFSSRTVKQIPSEPISFVIYAFLTDGIGDISLEVIIQRLDTLEEVANRSLLVHFKDPLYNARVRLRVKDFSFPVAGSYQVMLLAEGEMIAQRKLAVIQKGA